MKQTIRKFELWDTRTSSCLFCHMHRNCLYPLFHWLRLCHSRWVTWLYHANQVNHVANALEYSRLAPSHTHSRTLQLHFSSIGAIKRKVSAGGVDTLTHTHHWQREQLDIRDECPNVHEGPIAWPGESRGRPRARTSEGSFAQNKNTSSLSLSLCTRQQVKGRGRDDGSSNWMAT